MSVNVRVSAERERVRLGYLADACITHRRDAAADLRDRLQRELDAAGTGR
jgi:hypothetical protein